MKKEDAYNQDEFVHDVLDFLIEYDKGVMQGMNKLNELQERVNKAIKYINEKLIPYGEEWFWNSATIGDMVNKLLDILKGSDKE